MAAGRPREYDDRKQIVVRFPPELHARLKEAAEEREVSMNWLVNRAIEEYLDALIPVDEIMLTRPRGEGRATSPSRGS